MKNKKRITALVALAEEMNVQKNVRTNISTYNKKSTESANINRPKSRVVSNIPWYPKSKKLKKELKLIALHEDTSVTALIDEGIKMILKARGKDIQDYL
jgi:hypothetical protein